METYRKYFYNVVAVRKNGLTITQTGFDSEVEACRALRGWIVDKDAIYGEIERLFVGHETEGLREYTREKVIFVAGGAI